MESYSGGARETLKPGSEFKTSHIENNEKLLKKESINPPNLDHLPAWRAENEERVLAEELRACNAANHQPRGKKRRAQ